MKTKLKQIANIRLGHHFRERIQTVADGNYFVIQMKDIDRDGFIGWKGLTKVYAEKMNDQVLAREGEIIFANRGNRNYASLIDRSISNAVVTGNFFIIRVKETNVSPGYLAWYLNEKIAQKYFDQHREGSYIPTLRGEWLKELKVLIPSLETQKLIVSLNYLKIKEAALKETISKKQNLLIQELVFKKIERQS